MKKWLILALLLIPVLAQDLNLTVEGLTCGGQMVLADLQSFLTWRVDINASNSILEIGIPRATPSSRVL